MLFKLFLFSIYTTLFVQVNCFTNFSDIEECKNKICIPKCCPNGHYVHRGQCNYTRLENALDFSKAPIYNEDRTKIVTNLNDTRFHLVPNAFGDKKFKDSVADVQSDTLKLYLVERLVLFFACERELFYPRKNRRRRVGGLGSVRRSGPRRIPGNRGMSGVAYMELRNYYFRWTRMDSSQFCVDYRKVKPNGKFEAQFRFYVYRPFPRSRDLTLYKIALFTSSIFLAIVLVVYSLLPELRNLGGLILMAYVLSLLLAFLFLLAVFTTEVFTHTIKSCVTLTFIIYYWLLAAFCWMNIMSYDIWWTFRGYAKARQIHRRGEIFKFIMYCLYGFGVPLGLTILLAVMHFVDFSDKPWVVKPQLGISDCFIRGPERTIYLYVPMLTFIIFNWVLFLMTAFNVWRLSRGTAVLDSAAAGNPQAHRTQRHRFMVYMKLSIVMGLNWILEIIGYQYPELQIFDVCDIFNILVGLFIFLIFVFKKKIYHKLRRRFSGTSTIATKSHRSNSSNSSGSSREPSVARNPAP